MLAVEPFSRYLCLLMSSGGKIQRSGRRKTSRSQRGGRTSKRHLLLSHLGEHTVRSSADQVDHSRGTDLRRLPARDGAGGGASGREDHDPPPAGRASRRTAYGSMRT